MNTKIIHVVLKATLLLVAKLFKAALLNMWSMVSFSKSCFIEQVVNVVFLIAHAFISNFVHGIT